MDKETKKLSEALMVAFTIQNEVKSYLANLEKLKAEMAQHEQLEDL